MSHFLESQRIKLRPIQKDDLKELAELMSDREIGILSGEVHPITEKGMDDLYERCQQTDDRVWFVIIDKQSGKIIGETGFLRIFTPWRTSDYSLMIWDRAYWHQGYGTEVASLMLDYGFNSLNFHRVSIGVVGLNQNALRFWSKVGFKEEGKQIDGFYHQGVYSDFVMMYLLEDDFRKSRASQG